MNKAAFFVLLFIFTTLLGLYIGARMIPEVGEVNPATGASVDDPGGALYFLGVIFAGTAVVLLVLKYYRGRLLFRLFEAYIIFVGSMIVWDFLVYDWLVSGGVLGAGPAYNLLVLTLSAATVALRFAKRSLAVLNITLALAIAGAAGALGSFLGFIPALILVLSLGSYDIIAVFKTKHMLRLAEGSRLRQLPVMFETDSKGIKTGRRRTGRPGGRDTLGLGTGDVAIPIIFFVSILRGFQDWFLVGAAVAGAMAGLSLTIYYVTSIRRVPLPALPPIMGCSITALGVGILAKSIV